MPLQFGPITINSAIVGEDVRAEAHKKWSVVGIFSGDIIIPSVPAHLRLAVYGDGESSEDVKKKIYYRIALDGEILFSVEGQFEGKKGGIAFPIPSMVVPIAKAGTLHFELSEDGKTWAEIAAKKIIIGDVD